MSVENRTKIANCSYSRVLNAPAPMKGFPWNLVSAQGVLNASMMGLSDGRKSFKIGLVVLTQYRLWEPASQPRCRS